MNQHRSATVFISIVVGITVLSVTAANTSAAVILSSNTFARYGSGNTTYASDSDNGAVPHDGSNYSQVQNSHLLIAATGASNMSNNAIGAASGYLGASVIDHPPNGGTIWNLVSGGSVTFLDYLTVESSTLPPGSAVQLQFSFHVASSIFATHTITPGGDAFAMAWVDIGISVTNRGGAAAFYLDSNQNKAIRDNSEDPPTNLNLGLLNPNTPHLDVPFDAQVGDVILFYLATDANTHGKLSPYTVSTNPLVLDNAVSAALASVGMGFGATSLTPDVTLNSEQYAGDFPSAALADPAAAGAGLPPDPIPEPMTVTILLAAVLLRRRRRPARLSGRRRRATSPGESGTCL